jgi:hypothetical protein
MLHLSFEENSSHPLRLLDSGCAISKRPSLSQNTLKTVASQNVNRDHNTHKATANESNPRICCQRPALWSVSSGEPPIPVAINFGCYSSRHHTAMGENSSRWIGSERPG